MNGWKQVKLSDLCQEENEKYQPSNGGVYPYIGLEHIEQQSLRLNGIGNSSDVFSTKKVFDKGNVLYGSLRPYFRKVYLPKFNGVCSTDITVLSPKKNTDLNFLYYLISSKKFIDKASNSANGTKMPRAGWKIVKDFTLEVPDEIESQNKISSIIITYDKLIENNQKRIKILEEMVLRLYTEWFVKFKFPGHEKVKMADSGTEFGMIPDGWGVKRLSEFASLTMGQSPKSEFYNENGEGLPFHQGVSNFGYLYPENKVYSSKGNRIAKKGELLFSVRAPVGKLNIATSEMILGRGLASIRHKQNRQSFLLSMFFNKFTENDMLGNGSIYKSINKSELENLLFVVPSEKLMEIFEPISEKYFEKLNILTKRVTNLSRTRDLLIENLVTGKRILKS